MLLRVVGGLVSPFTRAFPVPFPAVLGRRVCAHTASKSRSEVQLAWVGCRWWEWECAIARSCAGWQLTKTASSSHAQGPAEKCCERSAAWIASLFSLAVEMCSGLSVGAGGMRSRPLYHVRTGVTRISHLSAWGVSFQRGLVALAVLGVSSSSEEQVPSVQTYFFHRMMTKVTCWSTPAANFSLAFSSFSCLSHTIVNDQCEVGSEEEN